MNNKLIRTRSSSYITNSYYIFDGQGHCIIIDPANSFSKAEKILEENIPIAIILTHGHFDHTYDCNLFREKYGSKVYVHEYDKKYLSDSKYGIPDGMSNEYEYRHIVFDGTFKDGDTFSFGLDTYTVIHTPGHTEGSCCIYTDGVLFSGDTLFKGSIGRTDFPFGCSNVDMKRSLKKLVESIPDDTVIYPGHGFQTIMLKEKQTNPYLLT